MPRVLWPRSPYFQVPLAAIDSNTHTHSTITHRRTDAAPPPSGGNGDRVHIDVHRHRQSALITDDIMGMPRRE